MNKTDDLQYAFFNGVKANTWETSGVSEQLSWSSSYAEGEKDCKHLPPFSRSLSNAGWTLCTNTASRCICLRFPGSKGTIYTFVNRDSIDRAGEQIRYPRQAEHVILTCWWNGKELKQLSVTIRQHFLPVEGMALRITGNNNVCRRWFAEKHCKQYNQKKQLQWTRAMGGSPCNSNWRAIPPTKKKAGIGTRGYDSYTRYR